MLGELLRVLRARELVVVGGADVDEGAGDDGGGGGVEGGVVDAVPVDLPDVEVLFYLAHLFWHDPVRGAPDFVRSGVVRVGEGGPEGAFDEGYDTPGL